MTNMVGNILSAIQIIIDKSFTNVTDVSKNATQNRANQMGDALEDYVKNAFAGCLGMDTCSVKQARERTFSYLGNCTNPPDAILKDGDAIEIKKIKTLSATHLQLNSSYPKNKLRSNNPKICNACRTCENWDEKDMLYVVGQVDGEELRNLFFVYGDLYCDSYDVYEKVERAIKSGLESLDDIELVDTNELGRINKIDHLGISSLRVRGMWQIKTPFHHFEYLINKVSSNFKFKLTALISQEKYCSFENVCEFEKFCDKKGVSISDERIEDPRNPANLINSKLITFSY